MFLHRPHAVHKDRCISPTSTCYIVSFEADEKGFESLFDRVITLTKKEITQLKEFFELFLNNVTDPIEKIVPERATIIKNNTFGISQIIKNKFELFCDILFWPCVNVMKPGIDQVQSLLLECCKNFL